jgi:predicted XRE-type DNA-binding protein
MSADIEIVQSSGNVFEDLGRPDADEKKTKVALAIAINHALVARKISQAEAARLLGTEQPKISALANYKLAGFSAARLMQFLTALGRDIEIIIRPSHGHGRILVHEDAC